MKHRREVHGEKASGLIVAGTWWTIVLMNDEAMDEDCCDVSKRSVPKYIIDYPLRYLS